MKSFFNKSNFFLIIILITGGFLRFYNLMWGNGYFFHPDENNMAISISQLSLNNKLDPNFFAYGQFPLYLTYFSFQVYSFIINVSKLRFTIYDLPTVPFSTAIFFLRFYSALASTLTILLVYLTASSLARGRLARLARLAALFAAFTPGLIQAAHFGTTESLLTFFFLLIIYLSFKTIESKKLWKNLFLLGIVCAIALASKLTAVYFLPPAFFAILINLTNQKAKFLTCFKQILLFTAYCLLLTLLFSPYNLLSFEKFRGTINYETAVATDEAMVFYTRQFENTTPFLFQIQKIFPYALGLPIFILGSLGFLFLLISNIYYLISRRLKKDDNTSLTILAFSFLIYLIPNAFLFAKWTRFMTPIFPFFAVFAGYFISILLISSQEKTASSEAAFNVGKGGCPLPSDTRESFITQVMQFVKSSRRAGDLHPTPKGSHRVSDGSATSAIHSPLITIIILYLIIILSIIPGAIFFFELYTKPDSRIQASNWIYENIPENSYVLSETANVVDIPISAINNEAMKQWNNGRVISFDFYHLDENPELINDLVDHLEKADYIFIPSRRIFANHMRLPKKYPILNRYYEALFGERLGFKLLVICDPSLRGVQNLRVSSCLRPPEAAEQIFVSEQIQAILIGDEATEETFTVFDHPTIRVYKKTKQYDKNDYRSLLTN